MRTSFSLAYIFLSLSILSGCSKKDKITSPSNQPLNTNFKITFGGNKDDLAQYAQQTGDGGYIIIGKTSSFSVGWSDVWLIKTDANGSQVWDKTFDIDDNYDEAFSGQQTSDGGYIITGGTKSINEIGSHKALLIKTDGIGNHVWEKIFGGDGWDAAYSVQQTTDGGYIIAGMTFFVNENRFEAWLIKTNTNGNQEWKKIFSGNNSYLAKSVQETVDNGYITAGYIIRSNDSDAWLIKTDANGNPLWEKTFGGGGIDEATSVHQTIDSGYIIAGFTKSFGTGVRDTWLIKIDANGNQIWEKTFGGSNDEGAYSVRQTEDGGYITVGYTSSFGAGENDVWLIKTDGDGNKVWDRTFGGSDYEGAYSVQQTADGGYIVAGYTESFGAGKEDVWLIKTDANGNVFSDP